MILIKANESTASRRRVYFHLVDADDGITPETGEAGEQPQVSSDGGAWTDTGIGVLVAVGNGRYYAELTQTLVATAGTIIETRFKSANTAECPGDSVQVVAFDPHDANRLGLGDINTLLTRIPNTLSLNAINTEVDSALGDYDAPTKTEMDAAFSEIKGAGWTDSTDTLEKIADSIAGGGVDVNAIADAVWEWLSEDATTEGTMAWLIAQKLGLITTQGIVTASIVATGEIIPIWRSRSRTITFVIPVAAIDLTGHTPKFGMTKITTETGSASLEVVGSLAVVGTDYHLTFELSTAQTAGLALSPKPNHPYRIASADAFSYTWSISATDGAGSCPQLAEGFVNVKGSDTTCSTS